MILIIFSIFQTVLPSILSEKDVSELLSSCLKTRPNAIVCGSTIVGSDKLVSESTEAFTGIMTQKAEAVCLFLFLFFFSMCLCEFYHCFYFIWLDLDSVLFNQSSILASDFFERFVTSNFLQNCNIISYCL